MLGNIKHFNEFITDIIKQLMEESIVQRKLDVRFIRLFKCVCQQRASIVVQVDDIPS